MEKIYTVPQVAEYLQISRSKMYDWVKKGKIPHLRIGRNIRIRESELLEWLEDHMTNYAMSDGQYMIWNHLFQEE